MGTHEAVPTSAHNQCLKKKQKKKKKQKNKKFNPVHQSFTAEKCGLRDIHIMDMLLSVTIV